MTPLTSQNADVVAFVVLAGLAAGALVAYGLQRAFGLERRRGGRGVSATRALDAISRLMPQTEASERESARSLARAGMRVAPSALWAARLACAAAGILLGFALGTASRSAVALVAGPALGCVLGALAPQLWLVRRRNAWREDIDRELPNALDLLCITVTAGGTLDFGVRTVAEKTTGTLAEALAEAVEAARFVPMTTALRRLADNADVRSLSVFVAALDQAEESGMAIADVLRSQADSARLARRQAIEERINRVALKMTFPMALIFMATLLVVLVPAAVQVIAALS